MDTNGEKEIQILFEIVSYDKYSSSNTVLFLGWIEVSDGVFFYKY